MKRREKIMLAIFAVDLFLLLFYNQVREDVRTNFTYKKILFWWFYFYPIAYFICIFRRICASVPKERSAIPL